jgi:hypothetical protein
VASVLCILCFHQSWTRWYRQESHETAPLRESQIWMEMLCYTVHIDPRTGKVTPRQYVRSRSCLMALEQFGPTATIHRPNIIYTSTPYTQYVLITLICSVVDVLYYKWKKAPSDVLYKYFNEDICTVLAQMLFFYEIIKPPNKKGRC